MEGLHLKLGLSRMNTQYETAGSNLLKYRQFSFSPPFKTATCNEDRAFVRAPLGDDVGCQKPGATGEDHTAFDLLR